MAIYLDNNVGLKIATVDLSEYITSITLTQTFDEVETTTMGQSAHVFSKGLESSTLAVDFLNDWAAAKVGATLQAAYGTSVTALIVPVKGSPTVVSATNPLYTVSILINNLTPVGSGGPGDYASSSMTFTCTSTVAYATSGTF
tara:strand:- start:2537 stop:2965 length:429 start_codon:yes stop_codon:yes gene_type:complete